VVTFAGISRRDNIEQRPEVKNGHDRSIIAIALDAQVPGEDFIDTLGGNVAVGGIRGGV